MLTYQAPALAGYRRYVRPSILHSSPGTIHWLLRAQNHDARKSRFSRGCEKRWARTESLGNLHIRSKEFAKGAESAFCTDFRAHRPLVYTPFCLFWTLPPP